MGLFTFHKLNEQGQEKAKEIQKAFELLIEKLEAVWDLTPDAGSEAQRSCSITKTKLEEACFFAKKTMAVLEKNQLKE